MRAYKRDGKDKGMGGIQGNRGRMVVKKKGACRVKCKRPSMVKLCGCFRNIKYSARLPARGFAWGIVIGYILSRL